MNITNNPQEDNGGWLHISDLVNGFLERAAIKGKLAEGLDNATNYFQKLKALREYYQANEENILKSFKRSRFGWCHVYPTDWAKIFTPIEFQAWQVIRQKGRIVLYPQFPVLEYYIDFANPGLKIGLELDGKEFHNKERDIIRDIELRNAGWTIYRITGSEMVNTRFKDWYSIESEFGYDQTEEKLDALTHWMLNTGDGVIQAIKDIHFERLQDKLIDGYLERQYLNLCYDTLSIHQS